MNEQELRQVLKEHGFRGYTDYLDFRDMMNTVSPETVYPLLKEEYLREEANEGNSKT